MHLQVNTSGAGPRCRRNDRSRRSCSGRGELDLVDFLFDSPLPRDHEEVHRHDAEHQVGGRDQPGPERRKPPDHPLHLPSRVADRLGGAGDLSIEIASQLVHTPGYGTPYPGPGTALDAGLKRLELLYAPLNVLARIL